MNINIYDLAIIIFILIGGIVGFKRGVIKQAVTTLGMILILILSFSFKNSISSIMYKTLPFFTTGLLKNYSALNIIVYELSAFFLLFSLLSTLLIILIRISGVVEKLLKATIILALPSKILGLILGLIESYIICFVFVFILLNPAFQINGLKESKTAKFVIKNTPIVSKYTLKTTKSFDEINKLLKNRKKYNDKEFNCDLIEILVKNKIISNDSIDYLYESGKINKDC